MSQTNNMFISYLRALKLQSSTPCKNLKSKLLNPMNSNIDYLNLWSEILVTRENELQHYFELGMQKTLNQEKDIKFIGNMLEEAEHNIALASILAQIDDLISSELPGEVKSLEAYQHKRPWLSEYLICSDPEFNLLLQERLLFRKLYNGPLDGIYGKYTKKAVDKFKKIEGIDEPELGPKTIDKILTS